jgi:SAM-dependent methyltransferase
VIHEISDWFPLNVDVAFDPFARPAARSLPWQYRSVTEWWPEFDCDGAESTALVDFVRASGQPGLEVGCGSGRRLLSCWNARLDVNGTESPGALLALCRQHTAHAGVGLFAQAFHELDLPRHYRSIYVGRAFGTSDNAKWDESALARLYRLLEPGGVLAFNEPAPGHETRGASLWRRISGRPLEAPQLPAIELRSAESGDVLRLSSQLLSFCPERRLLRYTVRAERWVRGERKASRGFALCQRFPSADETVRMLCEAGFERRRIHHGISEQGSLRCWIAEKASPPSARRGGGAVGPIGLAGALRLGA